MRSSGTFKDWLDYCQGKQLDHLNAMVGVGLGYIFGFFNIPEDVPDIIIPFTILTLVIFSLESKRTTNIFFSVI